MQSCLREICFLAASYEFVLKCRHLTTVENRLADLLSRWDLHSTICEEQLPKKNCHNELPHLTFEACEPKVSN
jgi:hypothetical protein